jgi:hypothetical protein
MINQLNVEQLAGLRQAFGEVKVGRRGMRWGVGVVMGNDQLHSIMG